MKNFSVIHKMQRFVRLVYALAFARIVRFTVKGANEAGVDLVLIQPCLFYYVNPCYVLLTSIFSIIFIRKGKRFLSKQGQP